MCGVLLWKTWPPVYISLCTLEALLFIVLPHRHPVPTHSKLPGQEYHVLDVQRRERKAFFCVGAQGLMMELVCRGSIGLHQVDEGEDVPGSCDMLTRAWLCGWA